VRRLLLTVAALATGLIAASPSALGATAPAPHLVEVGNVRFPDRAFVLTLPRKVRLGADAVQVRENGQVVSGVGRVQAQNAAVGRFGVVLVIDASQSMAGRPIEGAMAAARVFAKQRATNELLGVVTFNNHVDVPLVPTADGGAIDNALTATPTLGYGTYIIDAVSSALTLLKQSKVTVGSVVVLSDGRDTGSKLHLKDLTAQAQAAHVRLFSVGLRSYQFSPSTLKKLAAQTGAAYSEATSPKALTGIYQALSEQLGNEYLLQYHSNASPGELVHVTVSVAGFGTALAAYRTLALPAAGHKPFSRSFFHRLWLSSVTEVLVALAAGLLAAFAMLAIVRGGRYSLRARMAEFVSVLTPEDGLRTSSRSLANRPVQTIDRAFEGRPWWEQFKEDVEIAQISIAASQIVLITVLSSIVLAWLLGYALNVLFALIGFFIPYFATRAIVRRRLAERREAFSEQLPDNLNVLASALRSGHSFIGALSVMVVETEEPSRSEFRRAIADEQLGMPAEEALTKVAKRMANEDLEQVALVAALQRQTGGNTAEVLDTVVDTIRERFDLRRLVKTLTAQARITRWVLTALSTATGLFVSLLNPEYVKPLYNTGSGQVMLATAVVMVIAGSLLIKRLANIEI
jgi:tight adherence protein B